MDENALTGAESDFSDMDGQDETTSSEEVQSSDLETLVLAEVPGAYDSLTPLLAGAGMFFGAGILLAFTVWVIGYAVHSSYRILDLSGK